MPDDEKRERVRILAGVARVKIKVNAVIEKRGLELEGLGLKPFDALHVACAESSKVNILLTTDDQLLQRALEHRKLLKVRVENPITWLMEVLIR